MALDFSVLDPNTAGIYVTDGMDARYAWVGGRFLALGFGWGGTWKHRPDWDHAEILGPAPDAQSVEGSELLYASTLLSSPFLRA